MKNLLNKLRMKQPDVGDSEFSITVTDAGKQKVRSIIDSQDVEVEGLRIRIEGRTASAFQYELGLEETAAPDDVVIDCGDFKVLIDPDSAENLKGATVDYVENLNSSGFNIENPNTPTWDNSKAQKIQELIDEQINPAVAGHGGHIDLLDVKDDTIYIHMGGGCQGCGMASVTLKHGIESMIKDVFPEITQIIDSTDHAAGTNPYYEPSKG
jgi:Fe/S biogenesis protein NfuA